VVFVEEERNCKKDDTAKLTFSALGPRERIAGGAVDT
jgi:hypothetical protein